MLEFKKNWREAIARQKAFWERKMTNQVLARIFTPNPKSDLWLEKNHNSFQTGGNILPPQEKVRAIYEIIISNDIETEDDSLPVMIPSELDEGLYAGMAGGRPQFCFDPESGWFSSMALPFISDIADFNRSAKSDSQYWENQVDQRLAYYRNCAEGKYGISPIVSIDSLNFAVLARGAERAMLDLYDKPEYVHLLHEYALDLTIRIQERQRSLIGTFEGGTFDGYPHFGAWFPGGHINLSVDAYGMCGLDIYNQFGRPYLEKILNHFGGGFLHIHSNAYHLLPEVIKLPNLRGIWLIDEFPHPFDLLPEIQKITGDMPLLTECTGDEFQLGLEKHTLPTNVFYLIRGHKEGRVTYRSPGAKSVYEANQLMEKIKKYRV